MKKPVITIGFRVFASCASVLLIMAGMTAISVWRLHDAERAMAQLVDDILAKQLLTSELRGAIALNGVRALAIARSDSVELGDYFKAQLADGEREQVRLEAALAKLPRQGQEIGLMNAIAQHASTVRALRTQILP